MVADAPPRRAVRRLLSPARRKASEYRDSRRQRLPADRAVHLAQDHPADGQRALRADAARSRREPVCVGAEPVRALRRRRRRGDLLRRSSSPATSWTSRTCRVFPDVFRSKGWAPSAHAFGGVDVQAVSWSVHARRGALHQGVRQAGHGLHRLRSDRPVGLPAVGRDQLDVLTREPSNGVTQMTRTMVALALALTIGALAAPERGRRSGGSAAPPRTSGISGPAAGRSPTRRPTTARRPSRGCSACRRRARAPSPPGSASRPTAPRTATHGDDAGRSAGADRNDRSPTARSVRWPTPTAKAGSAPNGPRWGRVSLRPPR